MKKILFIPIVVIIFVLIFAVYFLKKDNNEAFEFTEYTFYDDSHENSKVTIKYPQIDDNNYADINKIIKDFVKDLPLKYYPSDYTGLGLEVTYKIPYETKNYLSVVFEGCGYVKQTAHPNRFIYAVNIDLSDKKIIAFSDICSTNSDIEKMIKEEYYNQFVSENLENFGLDSNDKEYESKKESYLREHPFRMNDSQEWFSDPTRFYLSKNGVVICIELIHAMGDYFETEISYSQLSDYLKSDFLVK